MVFLCQFSICFLDLRCIRVTLYAKDRIQILLIGFLMLLPLISPPFLRGMVKSPEFLDNIDNKNIVIASLLQENRKQLLPVDIFTEQIRQTLPAVGLFCLLYILYNTYRHTSQAFRKRIATVRNLFSSGLSPEAEKDSLRGPCHKKESRLRDSRAERGRLSDIIPCARVRILPEGFNS